MELADIRLTDAVVSVPQEWIDRCDTLRAIQADFEGQELYIPVTARDMVSYIENTHTPGSMYKVDGKWKIVSNGYLDLKPSPDTLLLADRLGDRWFLDIVSLEHTRTVAELGIYCLGTRLLNLAESAEFWAEKTYRIDLLKHMRFPDKIVRGRFGSSIHVYTILHQGSKLWICRLGDQVPHLMGAGSNLCPEKIKTLSIDAETKTLRITYTFDDGVDADHTGYFGDIDTTPLPTSDSNSYTVRGPNIYKNEQFVLAVRADIVYVDNFKIVLLACNTLTAYYYRHKLGNRLVYPEQLFKLKSLQLRGRVIGRNDSEIVTVVGEDTGSHTVTHYRFLPTSWS